MSQFNERFEGLSRSQQAERYMCLADISLQHYALGDVTPTFFRHNGGITYRLEGRNSEPFYLLKIAQPAGESGGIPPERIAHVMDWLAALAGESEIVVQEPVPNRRGELVTAVGFADLTDPFYVTVQRWIAGMHVRDAFTPEQAYRVGAMIGHLHEHSSHWTPQQARQGIEQDEVWLADRLALLSRVVDAGVLTPAEWRTVESAADRLTDIMRSLGRGTYQWGAIHADLHHENLLFQGESVCPIDFGDFRVGHFPYDLGVVLYHLMYLDDVGVRRAVRDGYQSVRDLSDASLPWPEGFLCAAALSNLSFQVTIPGHCKSPHNSRNVLEFATSFCRDLAFGKAFVFG